MSIFDYVKVQYKKSTERVPCVLCKIWAALSAEKANIKRKDIDGQFLFEHFQRVDTGLTLT
jgi:hypothetical protein